MHEFEREELPGANEALIVAMNEAEGEESEDVGEE